MAKLATRYPWVLIALTAVWVVFSGWYGLDIEHRLTLNPGWDAPESGSAKVAAIMRNDMHRDDMPVIVLFAPNSAGSPQNVETPEYRNAVESALSGLTGQTQVTSLLTYYSTGDARLKSKDDRMTYAIVNLKRGEDEGIAAFRSLRATLTSPRLSVSFGGELAVYVDVREQLDRDLRTAETVSFGLLAVLLIWVFRSGVAAMLPLIVGGATIISSVAWIKGATYFTDISVYAPNVVSMLGLGLAVDYSLFMVSRFREELALGKTVDHALRIMLNTAGRTLLFSGLTVAASLLCLLLLPQRFFHNMGLAGALAVATAMMASLLLLPALLSLLGHRVNSLVPPFLAKRPINETETGNWYRFSHFVMRNARVVLLVSLAILLVMGLPIKDMKVGPADSRALPPSAESRKVQDTIARDFVVRELSPVLLAIKTVKPLTDPDTLAALHRLGGQLGDLQGVTKVTGLLSLDAGLTLADYQMLYQHPEQFPQAAAALSEFASGNTTLMYVNYAADPTSEASRELVQRIRALPVDASLLQVEVGGFSAFHLDYLDSLRNEVPKVFAAIVVVIFVLLFLMLGSLLVPLKVVLTNLLSLSATFGMLVWVIQEGNLSGLLGFTPQGALDGTILVLIFASAFGLAIDYEVFLLSRVKEMCDATKGDSVKSVSTGMQRSGPIITNAALLIGVVLGAFAMGEVVFIKAIGLGLLLSVIIDATLVRMLLVPSTLKLMGWLNWWAPKPLMRVYQRLNMGEMHGGELPSESGSERKAGEKKT